MSGTQKAQSPAATGLSATNKADKAILTLAALKAGFERRGATVRRSANFAALLAFAQQMGAA